MVGLGRLEPQRMRSSAFNKSEVLDFVLMVGLGGLEPPTSHLSGAHSNQLSYKPSSKQGGATYWRLKKSQI